MLINGTPALACSVYVKSATKRGKILLEPLSKFPVVKDLVVDRAAIFESLKKMRIWLDEKDWSDFGRERESQYKAGQCLMCGCCLEVCPNFHADGKFAGASSMVTAYKSLEQNVRNDHMDEMKKEYYKRFFSYCGQSLSCVKVCPKRLPLDEIQARANSHMKHI